MASPGYTEVYDVHSSGIKVIIVGMGLGGLTAAIECHRKGHKVQCFEAVPVLKPIGDSIAVGSNAARIVRKWGNGSVDAELMQLISITPTMDIYTSSGELLVKSSFRGYGAGEGYPCHRGELLNAFYRHAVELGIEFHLGNPITEYWETEDAAGVVANGVRYAADVVIASDGVHSKARGPITGQEGKAHSSGYAIYRAWFDADEAKKDPANAWCFEGEGSDDRCRVIIGKDIHIMIGSGKLGKEVFWMLTHKDTNDIAESWSLPGELDDARKHFESWPSAPLIENIIKYTPDNRLIDFKLLWRDPLPTWTSKHGRMTLLGDAAHPILPTSGQGAGMAIEDGATVAIALRLGGKENVKTALKVYEKIRLPRATLVQRMGIETRAHWHQTDWSSVKAASLASATDIEMPRPAWIFGHDVEAHVNASFEEIKDSVLTGSEYKPTNVPADGQFHRTSDYLKEGESKISG